MTRFLVLLSLTLTEVSCGNVTSVNQDLSVDGSAADGHPASDVVTGMDGRDLPSPLERVGRDSDLLILDSGLPIQRRDGSADLPVVDSASEGVEVPLPLCPTQFPAGCTCNTEGSLACRCSATTTLSCPTDAGPLPLCGPEHLPSCACLSEGPLTPCRCPDNYAVTCRQ